MYIESNNWIGEEFEKIHPELMLENIRKQINSGIDIMYNVDYLKEYMHQYKYLKNAFGDESDVLSQLNGSLTETLDIVIDEISGNFDFEVNLESLDIKPKKAAKALYSFFVIKYSRNIVQFIINYIIKNKKNIIEVLKADKSRMSKTRKNVTTIATKSLFGPNDNLIMSNLYFIITNVIPSMDLNEDFLDYFDENSMTLRVIRSMFEDKLTAKYDNIFEEFYRPIIDEDYGYNGIISEVTTELSSIYMSNKNSIDLFEDEDFEDM